MTDNEMIEILSNDVTVRCSYFLCFDEAQKSYVICTADILDLINRQKAEIERLEKENDYFADIGKMYSEIKAEAIKEFAERLKKRSSYFHTSGGHTPWNCVKVYDIDDLVKEMVGDTE